MQPVGSHLITLPTDLLTIIYGHLDPTAKACSHMACQKLKGLHQKKTDPKTNRFQFCTRAAIDGHLNVLKWARTKNFQWDKTTTEWAAAKGHLDILQWAIPNGCPMSAFTCLYAASNGHLKVLQWAIANGCQWDVQTCSTAAQGGHLEVLQWARANGCPWGEKTCMNAARNGHLEVLKWAIANGCPWQDYRIRSITDNPDILTWLDDKKAILTSVSKGRP